MTPEERAKHILNINNYVEDCLMIATLANAIPEALREEREACAKVADVYDEVYPGGKTIAQAIRARGGK
jgi:hypothetical protein